MEIKSNQAKGDVLIVDDDASVCEIIEQFCMNLGCFRNIVIARDGIVAANKLRNQTFKIIFLDIKMPKKTGLDVLKEFNDRSLNSKSSVIVVSGEMDRTILATTLESGVKNFMMKPFTEADFQEKVLKMMTSKTN